MRKEITVTYKPCDCMSLWGSFRLDRCFAMSGEDRHIEVEYERKLCLNGFRTCETETEHGEETLQRTTASAEVSKQRAMYVPVLRSTASECNYCETSLCKSPPASSLAVRRNPSHEPCLYLPPLQTSRNWTVANSDFQLFTEPLYKCHSSIDKQINLSDSFSAHEESSNIVFPRNCQSASASFLEKQKEQPFGQRNKSPATRATHERNTQLYKFLVELLEEGGGRNCVVWIDRSRGIFRITDSARFAKLWGEIKLNPTMNYEKLARSFRHYYQKGILEEYTGSSGNGKRKLLYKFSRKVLDCCVYKKYE